jgi:hypothetical protein
VFANAVAVELRVDLGKESLCDHAADLSDEDQPRLLVGAYEAVVELVQPANCREAHRRS